MRSAKRRRWTTARSASTTSTSTSRTDHSRPSGSGTKMTTTWDSESSTPSLRFYEDLRRCNRTELYQLCKRAGLNPRPGATHEELCELLRGDRAPSTETNEIDLWRPGLKGFVQQRCAVLQPQLTCPIRQNIDACKGCLDTQVVTCVVEQRTQEPLIQ